MKKIFILFLCLFFATSVMAYELPAGKTINKEAVIKGIESCTEKISSNPKSEDAYINRAFLYMLSDNLSGAIADYDTLILMNPGNEEFYLNRGYLKHLARKREAAIEDYKMALKIRPNYAFAFNNIGVALAELGRNKESLDAYNTAIKIDPYYADAYYNRGNLKTNTNKNEEALTDFNIAVKLNPKDSASFNNRGVVKRKLNYNVGALSDFSIAIKLNPDDLTAYANRGRLKKRYFDSEGAEEDFKSAIAIAEESPNIVKQVEAQAEATIAKKQMIETQPKLRDSRVSDDNIQKIANKVIDKDDIDNTRIATVKATVLKVEPKSSKTNMLPTPLASQQEPIIETKPVINPELAECYFIRALQKYILQNREGALKDFNSAISHNPNYAEAYYYRAAIKRDFKDEAFIEDYRKAVQLNPNLKSVNDADVLNILK